MQDDRAQLGIRVHIIDVLVVGQPIQCYIPCEITPSLCRSNDVIARWVLDIGSEDLFWRVLPRRCECVLKIKRLNQKIKRLTDICEKQFSFFCDPFRRKLFIKTILLIIVSFVLINPFKRLFLCSLVIDNNLLDCTQSPNYSSFVFVLDVGFEWFFTSNAKNI